jgi:replicative DNA helicase
MFTGFDDRSLPCDYLKEQMVLGAVLIDGTILPDLKRLGLAPKHFYQPRHQYLFRAMLEMEERHQVIDSTTLPDVLKDMPGDFRREDDTPTDLFTAVGGIQYLLACAEACPAAPLAGEYAKTVIRKYRMRELAVRCKDLTLLALDDNLPVILSGKDHVAINEIMAQLTRGYDNPLLRGIISADRLPEPTSPPRIWFGLYQQAVVLLIGETGAGKSSLLYNIAIHAARNAPLWYIPFGLGRPLRVLYIDPENAGNFEEGRGGLCAVKIERIGQGRPTNLFFHSGRNLHLSNPGHIAWLSDYCRDEQIDLLILDPIATLFQTKDENDNAEAARQLATLIALSRETNTCVIASHHMGKDTTGIYGRGASARLAAADVGLVLRCRGDEENVDDTYGGELCERSDLCRVQIVKNRLEGRASLYLRMAGKDRFDLSKAEEWQARKPSPPDRTPKSHLAKEEILLQLGDGNDHSRQDLHDVLHAEGFGRSAIDQALVELVTEGRIQSKREGRGGATSYRLASATGMN